jgi:hypothetical protein
MEEPTSCVMRERQPEQSAPDPICDGFWFVGNTEVILPSFADHGILRDGPWCAREPVNGRLCPIL